MDQENQIRPAMTQRMEQEQIAHARQLLQEAEQRAKATILKEPGYANQRNQARQEQAMCSRISVRERILQNIAALDRERAGLVQLLDALHPNMHQFAPLADEVLFEALGRRR